MLSLHFPFPTAKASLKLVLLQPLSGLTLWDCRSQPLRTLIHIFLSPFAQLSSQLLPQNPVFHLSVCCHLP